MTKGRKGPKSDRFVVNMDDCHTPELVVQGFTTMLADIRASFARIDATTAIFRAEMDEANDVVQYICDVREAANNQFDDLATSSAVTIQRVHRGNTGRSKMYPPRPSGQLGWQCLRKRQASAAIQVQRIFRGRLARRAYVAKKLHSTVVSRLRDTCGFSPANTVLGLRAMHNLHQHDKLLQLDDAQTGDRAATLLRMLKASMTIQSRWRVAYNKVRGNVSDIQTVQARAGRLNRLLVRVAWQVATTIGILRCAWYTRHAGSDSVVKFTTSSHSTASLPPPPPPPSFASPKAKTNVVLLGNNKARSSSLPLTNTQRGTSLFGIVPNVVATTTEVTRAYQAVHSSVAPRPSHVKVSPTKVSNVKLSPDSMRQRQGTKSSNDAMYDAKRKANDSRAGATKDITAAMGKAAYQGAGMRQTMDRQRQLKVTILAYRLHVEEQTKCLTIFVHFAVQVKVEQRKHRRVRHRFISVYGGSFKHHLVVMTLSSLNRVGNEMYSAGKTQANDVTGQAERGASPRHGDDLHRQPREPVKATGCHPELPLGEFDWEKDRGQCHRLRHAKCLGMLETTLMYRYMKYTLEKTKSMGVVCG
ncbi:hypothetical protein AaE_008309 [Aphanomyces astaci]|uniref:Uncharacterized protein n=1 Tax=Aphanomyces astaci TaxID=112090 RepID=A0A6A5AFN7_APHAT|nr:hypothetical protein AaE_008309 [Aphanomyces astaci]